MDVIAKTETDYIAEKDWKGLAKYSAEIVKNKRFENGKLLKIKDNEYRDYVCTCHGNNKRRTTVKK